MAETLQQRIERKAEQLRDACIKNEIVRSPDNVEWKHLPEERKERWRIVAATYCHVFPAW